MININKKHGFSIIEILISLVILFIVTNGSLYTYLCIHERIKAQRDQRIALGVMQGLMEETISYIYKNFEDYPNIKLDIEKAICMKYFYDDIITNYSYDFINSNNIDFILLFDPPTTNGLITTIIIKIKNPILTLQTDIFIEEKPKGK